MSKSTKWMKKGFAWLLCLIMMTGMLSSAVVAADETVSGPSKTDTHISFSYESFGNASGIAEWTDGGNSTSINGLKFDFTINLKKHSVDNKTIRILDDNGKMFFLDDGEAQSLVTSFVIGKYYSNSNSGLKVLILLNSL